MGSSSSKLASSHPLEVPSKKAAASVLRSGYDAVNSFACSSVRTNCMRSQGNSRQASSSSGKCIAYYQDVATLWMDYEVYLCKSEDSKKCLHHFIILTSKDRKVCCKLELNTPNSKTEILSGHAEAIFQVTKIDESVLEKAIFKGKIFSTLGMLLSYGERIVQYDYEGVYHLLHRNCQEFCNDFLQGNGLKGYDTDSKLFRNLMQLPELKSLPAP